MVSFRTTLTVGVGILLTEPQRLRYFIAIVFGQSAFYLNVISVQSWFIGDKV